MTDGKTASMEKQQREGVQLSKWLASVGNTGDYPETTLKSRHYGTEAFKGVP